MLPNWALKFPGFEPVAHRLRSAFPTRWVRFHSLPGSKRYPENEGEYQIILDRQNRILAELVGPEPRIILLTTEASETEQAPLSRSDLQALDPNARPWRSFPMNFGDHDFIGPNHWHVFASDWAWKPGVLDPILRLAALGPTFNLMIVDPGCEWIVHPYDGGTDVIHQDSTARDRLKSAHQDWLSPLPSGL